MGAHVQCPRCDQAYALSDEQMLVYAGREFECTQCNTRFVVPRTSLKSSATSTLRGELPREQVTAGAVAMSAPPKPFTPGFIPTAGYRPFSGDFAGEPGLGSGLAVAALVCGLVGLIIPIVPALLAIGLGMWAVVRIHQGRAEGASIASGAVALGFAGLVIGTAIFYQRVLPALTVARRTTAYATCTDNFKSIGGALKRYAADHEGHFPDGLDALVEGGFVPADALVCPMTNDTKAVGASLTEIAQHVRMPGHNSYIYAGKGLTTSSPAECVLLYEPLDAHHEPGMNVLFVDGRVETISKLQADKAIRKLSSGQNPPW
jgi:predicted Zn finger-like uncharacterized protein/prepilin-type processing-associated H-X9-DG protein